MTDKQIEQFNRMRAALKRIAKDFETPEKIQKISWKKYGLPYEEALEYAYQNVKAEAAKAINGVSSIRVPIAAETDNQKGSKP